jgi:hypothetical protein
MRGGRVRDLGAFARVGVILTLKALVVALVVGVADVGD